MPQFAPRHEIAGDQWPRRVGSTIASALPRSPGQLAQIAIAFPSRSAAIRGDEPAAGSTLSCVAAIQVPVASTWRFAWMLGGWT
jgi:hypothetical protein